MLIYLFFGGRGGSNIIRSSTCRKESRERGQRSKGGCSIHNTSWLVGQMLETSSRGRAYPSNLSINGSILKFNSRGRILLLFQPGPVKSFKGLLLWAGISQPLLIFPFPFSLFLSQSKSQTPNMHSSTASIFSITWTWLWF